MADIGTEFLTFLKAYYPEDYGKAASDNVSDAVLTAISTKHKAKFDIWLKVPERIRDEYLGRVPNDILEAAKTDNNLTLAECRKIEAERTDPSLAEKANEMVPAAMEGFENPILKSIVFNKEEQQKITSNAQKIMKSGYSEEASVKLGSVPVYQNRLLKARETGEISEKAFKEAWGELRKDQKSSIAKDWIDNRPEKMYVYVAKRFNSGEIGKEEATEQMEALMKRIKAMGREQELDEYIKQPKSGYSKLNSEALELFSSIRENTQADPNLNVYAIYEKAGILEKKQEPKVNMEIFNSWLDTNNTPKNTLIEDWVDNQPEKMYAHVAKELSRGKIDKQEAAEKMEALMQQIKALGREKELEEYIKQPKSGYSRLNDDAVELFNSIKEKTVANSATEVKQAQTEMAATQTVATPTLNKEDAKSTFHEIANSHRKAIKQDWIDNQPEKMIAHIAKELNRGNIDKETALPQMDTLMKKVKNMGREQEFDAYLKQPQSGYTKLNEDNKILFNELMLSHDVGSVAQSLNKVRTMKQTTENTVQVEKPALNIVQQPTKGVTVPLQIKQTERA